PLPQIIIALGHVWVLCYGAHLVGQGHLNIGELVASVLLVNTLVLRVEGIGRIMQIFADARASAARIWELLDARPRITGGHQPVPEGDPGMRLIDVSVNPLGQGNPILSHCSLAINAGEILAVVGATGSGNVSVLHVRCSARRPSSAWTTLPVLSTQQPSAEFSTTSRSEEHTSELQSRENLVCR